MVKNVKVLTQLVSHSAELCPDKIAYKYRDQSITYAELANQCGKLASCLRKLGAKTGDRIGIYGFKSLQTPVAVHGIMAAGAAFVPLDPLMPTPRLATILKDCDIKIVISQPQKQRDLKKLSVSETPLTTVIGLEQLDDIDFTTISWNDVNNGNPQSIAELDLHKNDLAYIMYTSGSTGTPKGLMHTHGSGLSYAKQTNKIFDLTHHDVFGGHSPLHFDMSTMEYLAAPLAGGTSILIPEDIAKLPASMTQLAADEAITIWYSVSYALVQLASRGNISQHSLDAIRWVLYGGEPLGKTHMEKLIQLLPQARFGNVYGPAETNQCTFYEIPKHKQVPENIPIGKYCDNAQGLIVDNNGDTVTDGETGELLIHTSNLMKGYWNREELNREVFEYRDIDGEALCFYRTGDFARRRDDGELEFLGRKDRQIKIRGFRIELDEIENCLYRFPQTEEAAVFCVANDEENQKIIAALSLKRNHELSEKVVQSGLKNWLPSYALPGKVYIVKTFPRTASEKINRKELVNIYSNHGNLQNLCVA